MSEDICPLRPLLETKRDIIDGKLKLYRSFICPYLSCNQRFNLHRQYHRHVILQHFCDRCSLLLENKSTEHLCQSVGHQVGSGSQGLGNIQTGMFTLTESVFRGILLTFTKKFDDIVLGSVSDTFELVYNDLSGILLQCLARFNNIRASVSLNVTLQDMTGLKERNISLLTPFQRIFSPAYLTATIMSMADYLITSINVFAEDSSGYRLAAINFLQVRVAKYRPIRPRGHFIPIPKGIVSKFIINIKCQTNCLIFCILAAIKRDSIRIFNEPTVTWENGSKSQKQKLKRLYENSSSYIPLLEEAKRSGEIDFTGMEDNPDLEQLDQFEINNPCISVSVFSHEGSELFPIRVTADIKKHHVDLLLLKKPRLSNSEALPLDPIELKFDYHICLLKDLVATCGHKGYKRAQMCGFCFTPSQNNLHEHQKICAVNCGKKITFPEGSHYEFKRLSSYEDIPAKIFFSFQFYPCSSANLNEDKVFLNVKSYSILAIGPLMEKHNQILFTDFYSDQNPVEHFLSTVFKLSLEIQNRIRGTNVPIKMSHKEHVRHQLTVNCEICDDELEANTNPGCRHHDHITGEYRMTLCVGCNGAIRIEPNPILIGHGISERELHVILKSLKPEMIQKSKVILRTSEEIVSLKINNCRFLDSKFFLNADLDSLVQRQRAAYSLEQFPDRFPIFYNGFEQIVRKQFQTEETFDYQLWLPLLLQPVYFPPVLYEIRQDAFPHRSYFLDPLNGELPDDEEYHGASNVYTTFHCKNMDQFSKLMALRQVHLLADVMISFVEYAMKHFKLSPLWSYTLASYSVDICFSSLVDKFAYVKDIDMINFLQMRGGPVVGARKLLQANNERLKTFNGKAAERSHILILDENNMYAHCLSKNLAFDEYEWMSEEELKALDISTIKDEDDYGFFLKCDILYDKSLHDRDNQLPYCVSKRRVNRSELSEQQQKMWDKAFESKSDNYTTEKILLDLNDKIGYVDYGATLAFYQRRGLTIINLSKGIRFRQKPYLRPFFLRTMELRAICKKEKDEIGSLFLKGVLVRIFGTMLRNSDDETETLIVLTRVDALHYLAKHSFKDYTVICAESGTTLFHMRKNTCHYKNPIFASIIALSRAKQELYRRWEMIRNAFAGSVLGYGDCDSLFLEIPDPLNNYFQTLKSLSHRLDFSNLHPMNYLYSSEHAGKAGFWKVVTLNAIEFVTTASKSYSVKSQCDRCGSQGDTGCPCTFNKRASGIPRSALSKLTHDYFKDCLFNESPSLIQSNIIRSINHQLTVIQNTQIGFSSLNPQRHSLPNRLDSLALGHWRIKSPSADEEMKDDD